MKRYVLTLAHSPCRQSVVVLGKIRGPEGVAGRINFPGGHIEEGESAEGAAVRELQEETGLVVAETALRPVAYKMSPGAFELFVFAVEVPHPENAASLTEELVRAPAVEFLFKDAVTTPAKYGPDFLVLLAMALDATPRPSGFITLPSF